MADTRVQLEAEDWVRRTWLGKQFGTQFTRDRVTLEPGGQFDFDAVSDDRSVICTISTSTSKTRSGNYAVGKMMKLRADMLFLLMAPARQRIVVLTSKDMYEQCMKEKQNGRVPSQIGFLHAELPPELAGKLAAAQQMASDEVSPGS